MHKLTEIILVTTACNIGGGGGKLEGLVGGKLHRMFREGEV